MYGEEIAIASERSFMLTNELGDIEPGTRQGLFAGDTRFLSCLCVTLNGVAPVGIGGGQSSSDRARFYATNPALPGAAAGTLLLERSRHIDGVLTERLCITNRGSTRAHLCLRVELGADFADVFELRAPPEAKRGPSNIPPPPGCDQAFAYQDECFPCKTLLHWSRRGRQEPCATEFDISLRPGETWRCRMKAEYGRADSTNGDGPAPAISTGTSPRPAIEPERHHHARNEDLSAALPLVRERALADLKTLQFQLPSGERIIGAGLPYFMTLFGRDSILCAYLMLSTDPSLAADVLRALALHQGSRDEPDMDEEPGKIPHEIRDGELAQRGEGSRRRYYGSVDATPLFLILLGRYVTRTGDFALAEQLWPAAEAALAWIDRYGDLDGDGFVEYERRSSEGLENQGWKDSWDSICFARGALAATPIALCEVQGYVYEAKLQMAAMYERRGNRRRASQLRAQTRSLREHFEAAFWLPKARTYALALDGGKRQVNAIASNAAHCLWSGIATPEHARLVTDRLSQPDCFSGWGLRTLSNTMARYNPIGYHTGSVWPHDTVLAAEGMLRYGLAAQARRLLEATLSAALRMPNHRLPELFAGYSRRTFPAPLAYPDASAPQAWAAAAGLRACELLEGLHAEALPTRGWPSASTRALHATSVDLAPYPPASSPYAGQPRTLALGTPPAGARLQRHRPRLHLLPQS